MSLQERNNVHCHGDGRYTMMLVHGYGCDQTMWRFLYPYFAERYQVILLDLVGSGGSDLSAYDREKYGTLHGYAADMLEIIDEFATGPAFRASARQHGPGPDRIAQRQFGWDRPQRSCPTYRDRRQDRRPACGGQESVRICCRQAGQVVDRQESTRPLYGAASDGVRQAGSQPSRGPPPKSRRG